MTRMRAVVIARPGGPEVLELRDVPRPSPGEGHVLVRVRASAINRADLLQREGRYPAPAGAPADIPGLEFAGDVAECGPGVALWREGDRVFGIAAGGAQAEYLVAHERMLARVPERLSFTEAAAVPEVFITAHDALVTQAAVRPSERVLVHAVGSGVGLAAIQLARAVGALPFGSARTADKIERARQFGLEDGVVVGDDPATVISATSRWSDGAGMNVVLELVGGAYLVASIGAAAPLGRIILIGTMGGASANVPLSAVLGKRLSIRGTMLRGRPLEEKILATRAFDAQVVPLLARGVVRPAVHEIMPMERIRAAHELVASNRSFGKVVVEIA